MPHKHDLNFYMDFKEEKIVKINNVTAIKIRDIHDLVVCTECQTVNYWPLPFRHNDGKICSKCNTVLKL